MKLKNNKKGIQLNEAFGAVLTLVLVAVLVIIAIYMFTSLGTSVALQNTAASVQNESGASLTSTGYTLAKASLKDFSSPSIVQIYNTSSGAIILPGNYTLTGSILTNATTMQWSTVHLNYTYKYTLDTAASNASDTMITNFSGYPALVGLVGTIIFLGIVIGVLVASFVFGRKSA